MRRLLIGCVALSVSLAGAEVTERFIVELDAPAAAELARGKTGGRRHWPSSREYERVRREQELFRRRLSRLPASEAVETLSTLSNAVIVRTTGENADRLAALPGVRQVYRAFSYRRQMDAAPAVHHIPEAWTAVGGWDRAGEGVMIGILDSCIGTSHPAFQDPWLPMPPGYPRATTAADLAYTTNKVILTRNYKTMYAAGGDLRPVPPDGHGTTVASAAAGARHLTPAGVFSGVAPKAWLGNYCMANPGEGDAFGSDVVAKAIDDAAADGMDVINLSLGSPTGQLRPKDDIVTKLLERAEELVAYSTFLGGARDDTALAIAVDAQGVAYITGTTYSPDFPTTPGVLSREFGDPSWDIRGDGFLVKLGVNGSELAFSTYLPASEGDMVTGVAVDPDGNIHLTGHTYSDDWPTTRTAHQDVFCVGFGYDSFYTKLTPAGNSVLYSTYLCGGGHDMAQAIALDGAGNIYIAGRTESADFPTTGGSHTDGEKDDAFLTKFDPTGKLLWSRFVGGRGADAALALVVDYQNRPAIAGSTTSSDLPASGGVFQSQHADSGQYGDAFAAGFEAANGSLRWLSYYGGGNHDYATGLSMDSSGNVYLAGFTASPDLPTTSTACMTGYRGGGDAFVAKFSPGAAALDWSLFFGGNDRDAAHGVAIDRQGAVYAAGQTLSGNFPTSAEALASAYGRGLRGVSDAFALKLAPGAAPAANCIAINGVLNNASMLPGPVSPGEIVTIFGAGLGPDAPALFELTPDNRMKTGIAGTRILFDNTPAPVIFTYAYQVAAVVPYSLAGKTSTMLQVEYLGVKTPAVKLGVTDAAPAVLTINSSGRGPGAVLNQDYSVNSAANPAARGSIVMIFATGEGQTSPPGQDGLLALGVLPAPLLPIRLLVGNTQAELVYAGAAPGLVAGVMQVNAKIPVDIPPGSAVPLTLMAGERRSPPGVTIAVK